MNKVVIVEGIIGAGKSCFSDELAVALGENTLVLTEPDEREGGNPYLADYYADPARWAFSLQMHMLMARFELQKLAQAYVLAGKGNAVLDRSYYGDVSFSRLQLRKRYMTNREYDTYAKAYKSMTCSVLLPAICVQLLVKPEVALARIKLRSEQRESRAFEGSVGLPYLQELQVEIDRMLNVLKRQGVNVISVPWDEHRFTAEAREMAVGAVADRVLSLNPMDFFDLSDKLVMNHIRMANT